MALTSLSESLERHAVDASLRRESGNRLTAEDATRRQRERRRKKGRGVFAALAAAGIRLALSQRRAIERLCRAHPELLSMELSPEAAVERLIAHGIELTDAQLGLIGDETTVSGIRRVSSQFEATEISERRRETVNMRAPPVAGAPEPQEQTRTVLDGPRLVRKPGLFERVFRWFKR